MLGMSAREMAKGVRQRKFSATDLMSAHLAHIATVNSRLNAAVEVFREEAISLATRADDALSAGEHLGPLHGVPFSVKDSMDVRGYRTTAGTLGRAAAPVATNDAELVGRLRTAGAIPICKTNLPDLLFAYESDNLLFGRSNNPYALDRTPGGSSGGESALIAAGGSPLGLGSDAAGSVRVPAAFCGIASIKPTSGRLPRTGHVPPAGGWIQELWQIGPMARHVEDLQLAMSILAGADGRDLTSPPLPWREGGDKAPLRIAFFTDNGFASCQPAVESLVTEAAEALRSSGAHVEEVRPPGVEQAFDLEMRLLGSDGGEALDHYMSHIGSNRQHWLLHAGFVDRLRTRRCSMIEFGELWSAWDAYRSALASFFQEFDAVLCPVFTGPALLHGQSAEAGIFEGFSYTMAWNVAGNPAAVVRFGEVDGLPLNVQVVTPYWHEERALQICRTLEEHGGGWRASALFAPAAGS